MTQRVEKLDDPKIFDAIRTGLKTTSGIKPYEIAKHNSLFNQFRALGMFDLTTADKHQLAWIAENWHAIVEYVKATYVPPKFAPSTLRGYLEAIANLLLAVDKNKFKSTVRPLFNTGLSMQQVIDKASEDSEMTEAEKKNFVPYEDLVKVRDRIHAEWLADPKNLRLHMFQLILALNTMIPPLRLNWVGMEVWPPRLVEGAVRKSVVTGPPPDDVKTNYIWEQSPGHWSLVLNYDKIENKRVKSGKERQIIRLDDDIPGVTDGKGLTEIINKSLALLPRNDVLLGIKTKQAMGVSGYDSALAEMFKPKKPRQNLLRKAYVNYWYRKELSVGALKEIADRMRHSIGVALGSYRKIGLVETESKHDETPETMPRPKPATLPIITSRVPETLPIVPPRVPPPVMTPPRVGPPVKLVTPVLTKTVVVPPEPYFVPKEYSAAYREAHRESIMRKKMDYYWVEKHKILRAKILGNLNNGVVKTPKKSSIEKYQLRQNKETGKWYHLGAE